MAHGSGDQHLSPNGVVWDSGYGRGHNSVKLTLTLAFKPALIMASHGGDGRQENKIGLVG